MADPEDTAREARTLVVDAITEHVNLGEVDIDVQIELQAAVERALLAAEKRGREQGVEAERKRLLGEAWERWQSHGDECGEVIAKLQLYGDQLDLDMADALEAIAEAIRG